ncbi:MAG: MFS transporter [Chthoniobacterales bacterium]|nr:MFS transporter [Chthoniobacterales bacterium]
MPQSAAPGLWKIIGAASAGTLIEWYDFYLFGSLATVISTHFFPPGHPTAAFLSTLAVFATGFIVRPFGALVFGRLGDVVGRKHTFLLTLLLMGGSTFAIGLLPTYGSIGIMAPILLVLLRLLQGLSVGGEFGGAATYVAEHAPDPQRGFYTGWIQTTATLGLLMSLGIILATQHQLGATAFKAWGWRVPFLLSILLVLLSYYIRSRMAESPLFAQAKAAGELSASPLRESFLNKANRRLGLLALFGAVAGHGVVWYAGQFYALFFLQKVAQVEFATANQILAWSLVLTTPFYVVFGALSDHIGRKPVILAGCALAAVFFVPVYQGLLHFSSPLNFPMLVALVSFQMLFGTMTYGPLAAFLVELFPTRIRYTAMSLPYHLGIGVLGGLTPLIASALVAQTGNNYMGLAYPIVVAVVTVIVGVTFIREKRGVRLDAV